MKKINTKTIVTLALLVAMHIVLSRFLSVNAWNMKIGFAFTAIFIAAYLYGPVAAAVTGALGDLLGAILFPIGPYFPGFTVSCALTGIVYGLLLYKEQSYKRIIVAACINNLIISLLINSLWISVLYGTPFNVLIATRLVQVAILIPVEIITMKLLSEIMRRINARKLAGVDLQSEIMEKRRLLRKEKIAARDSLSEEERKEKSIRICNNIRETVEYKNAKAVLIYSHVKGEADISFLTSDEDKLFAYPVIISNAEMKAAIPEEGWTKSEYGIPEPVLGLNNEVSPEDISLIISPCTAFDERCGRLGMGGGYYDRFIEKCTNAKIISAAFECQKAEDVYMMSWDKRSDYVITEENTYIALDSDLR